jgi:hypothetical protein
MSIDRFMRHYSVLLNDDSFNPIFDDFFCHNLTSVDNSCRSQSVSTRIVNGRQVVTKKIVENGVETVIVEEDGVMTHKTVNGHQVALEY